MRDCRTRVCRRNGLRVIVPEIVSDRGHNDHRDWARASYYTGPEVGRALARGPVKVPEGLFPEVGGRHCADCSG